MRNGFLIIASLGDLTVRTRLWKMARQAHDLGLPVGHWGWVRYMPDKDSAFKLGFELTEAKMLMSRESQGKWSRIYYPIWMLVVFIALVFRRRPKEVYCLGLETALPAWACSFIRKTDYIFDDADRLVMVLPMPKMIRGIVSWLERKVSARSMAHLIPGRERYPYTTDKQMIIRNTPNTDDLERAMAMELPEKSAPLVIYASGWLGETRGLPIVNKLAKHFAGDDRVHFLVAGRIDGPSATELITLPNVTYEGEVESDKALAYSRIADLLVTLYDPAIEINRFAESNKWGDAIFIGLPVLVNSEVVTSSFLQQAGAAFAFPYNDSAKAIEIVEQLANDSDKVEAARKRVIELRSQMHPFDEAMKPLLLKLK